MIEMKVEITALLMALAVDRMIVLIITLNKESK